MADADDMEGQEVEMEEEIEAEESSPPEEDAEAGEACEEGGEEDEEALPVEEDGGEGGENAEAGEGEENVEEETAEAGEAETAEPLEEPQPEEVELEIRDEDEGRPVSSLSKKVTINHCIALKTTDNILFSSSSVRHLRPASRPSGQGQGAERDREDDPRNVGIQGDVEREQRPADRDEDHAERADSLLVRGDRLTSYYFVTKYFQNTSVCSCSSLST